MTSAGTPRVSPSRKPASSARGVGAQRRGAAQHDVAEPVRDREQRRVRGRARAPRARSSRPTACRQRARPSKPSGASGPSRPASTTRSPASSTRSRSASSPVATANSVRCVPARPATRTNASVSKRPLCGSSTSTPATVAGARRVDRGRRAASAPDRRARARSARAPSSASATTATATPRRGRRRTTRRRARRRRRRAAPVAGAAPGSLTRDDAERPAPPSASEHARASSTSDRHEVAQLREPAVADAAARGRDRRRCGTVRCARGRCTIAAASVGPMPGQRLELLGGRGVDVDRARPADGAGRPVAAGRIGAPLTAAGIDRRRRLRRARGTATRVPSVELRGEVEPGEIGARRRAAGGADRVDDPRARRAGCTTPARRTAPTTSTTIAAARRRGRGRRASVGGRLATSDAAGRDGRDATRPTPAPTARCRRGTTRRRPRPRRTRARPRRRARRCAARAADRRSRTARARAGAGRRVART